MHLFAVLVSLPVVAILCATSTATTSKTHITDTKLPDVAHSHFIAAPKDGGKFLRSLNAVSENRSGEERTFNIGSLKNHLHLPGSSAWQAAKAKKAAEKLKKDVLVKNGLYNKGTYDGMLTSEEVLYDTLTAWKNLGIRHEDMVVAFKKTIGDDDTYISIWNTINRNVGESAVDYV